MKKLLYILIPFMFLIACDDRKPDYADLNFDITEDAVYNRNNYNEFNITVQLSGKKDKIAYKYVYFEFDHDVATFFGGSTYSNVQTDENGYAEAELYIMDFDYRGEFHIQASYENQSVTRTIMVEDIPNIAILTADPETIPADGASQSRIRFELTSPSDNIVNQRINFTSNLGNLVPNTILTNEEGKGEIIFVSGEEVGAATIVAELAICPEEKSYVYVVCE